MIRDTVGINTDLRNCIEALKDAPFIAIDGEFTGIKWPQQVDDERDDVQTAMAKKSYITERYSIIQIGIATMTWDAGLNDWRHQKYSFYLPQRAFSTQDPEAMKYLKDNGFSLDKWHSDSLNGKQQQLLWKALKQSPAKLVVHGPMDILALLVYFEMTPLPEDLGELSNSIASVFPHIYDVAHLSRFELRTAERKKTKWAQGLWNYLQKCRNTNGLYQRVDWADRKQAHDAGEDAVATLEVFYYMMCSWGSRAPHVFAWNLNHLFLHEHFKTYEICPTMTLDCQAPPPASVEETTKCRSVEQTPRSTAAASSLHSSEEMAGQYYSESHDTSSMAYRDCVYDANPAHSSSPGFEPCPVYSSYNYSPSPAYNSSLAYNPGLAYAQTPVFSTNPDYSHSQHFSNPTVVYSTHVGNDWASQTNSRHHLAGLESSNCDNRHYNNMGNMGYNGVNRQTGGNKIPKNIPPPPPAPPARKPSNKIGQFRCATEMWLAPDPVSSEDVGDEACQESQLVNHNGIPIQYQ